MEVRVLHALPTVGRFEKDYLRVHTCSDPANDTVTLATIERVTDKTVVARSTTTRVRKLVERQPMSTHLALELATSYAERKHIPVVYTHAA
ncbi:MAG: hypothetical protein ABI640_09810 [Gammaproteobacteria bacterium]